MIFAVIAVDKPSAISAAILKTYPTDHFVLVDGQWLVADRGTAKEVSDKLGISDGSNGPGLVVSMSGYFGLKGANLWEWIKVKLEASP